MKVRMKVGATGTFLGIEAGTDCCSVHAGDIVDVPDWYALNLIRSGQAEVKLDGPLGRPWQLSMPEKDFEALKAKIGGRQPLRDQPKSDPARPKTREEKDRLLRAIW
jgi:hypothetical protein